MNAIVKLLIIGDVLTFSGFGFISPIFAVFIKDDLKGGSLAAVGVASMIYLVTKAVLQIPIARWTDKEPANVREFWTGILGYGMVALVPFLYLLIDTVEQLYFVQFVYGVAAALAYPGWMAIFTKFADHEKAASSWSVYSTSTILGMAITAALGGWLGQTYGFSTLLILVGIFTFLGFFATAGLVLFYDQLKVVHPEHVTPLGERIKHALRLHKHPIVPPGKIDGIK